MPHLLVATDDFTSDVYMGGIALADASVRWPNCRTCKSFMQFIAHIPLSDSLEPASRGPRALLLFQGQAQPGSCDEWDPSGGGNAALLSHEASARKLSVPIGTPSLSDSARVALVEYLEPEDFDAAQELYDDVSSAPDSRVVGKVSGMPLWIQYDETPSCECGTKMSFVVQLEERGVEGLNFGGGGCAYAFVCVGCKSSARFLWQC